MPLNLRLAILVTALTLTYVIVKVLKKRLIPVKYSILWWIGVLCLLILTVFPDFLIILANQLGFQTISNMVSGVLFLILIFITISLTVIVSAQKKKITLLIQETSILKADLEKLKEKICLKD